MNKKLLLEVADVIEANPHHFSMDFFTAQEVAAQLPASRVGRGIWQPLMEKWKV